MMPDLTFYLDMELSELDRPNFCIYIAFSQPNNYVICKLCDKWTTNSISIDFWRYITREEIPSKPLGNINRNSSIFASKRGKELSYHIMYYIKYNISNMKDIIDIYHWYISFIHIIHIYIHNFHYLF